MNAPLLICVLSLCLAMSFLMSGMEAGVFALSRLRIRHLMRRGQPRAEILHHFLSSPENFLWTILVGNTLANFFAVGIMVYVLHGWFARQPELFVAVFLVVIFLFYAVCDLLPKMQLSTGPA